MFTLNEAILNEDTAKLGSLITSGKLSLNSVDETGITPLQFATMHGKLKSMKCLIDLGADVNFQDKTKQTALFTAVLTDNIEAVKVLTAHIDKTKLNDKDYRNLSVLHHAAKKGNIDLIDLLIKKGANPNIGDYTNNTPLHLLVRHGHLAAIKFAHTWGMDVNSTTASGVSPIVNACIQYRIDMVKELLTQGAHLTPPINIDLKILYLVFGGAKLAKYLSDPEKFEGMMPADCAKLLSYYLIEYFIDRKLDPIYAEKILKHLQKNDFALEKSAEAIASEICKGESYTFETGHSGLSSGTEEEQKSGHSIYARLEKDEHENIKFSLYDKGQYCGELDPESADKHFCIRTLTFTKNEEWISKIIELLREAKFSKNDKAEEILFKEIPAIVGKEYLFKNDIKQKPFKIGKCGISNFHLALCDIFIKVFPKMKDGLDIYKDFSLYLREAVARDFKASKQDIPNALKTQLNTITTDIIHEKRSKHSSITHAVKENSEQILAPNKNFKKI